MHSISIKLFLLAFYPIFLSVFLRFSPFILVDLDLSINSYDSSIEVLHPLSSENARKILNGRGISYSDVFEKEELHNLVLSSGMPTREELSDFVSAAKDVPDWITFNSDVRFDLNLKRNKDSPWLLQIVKNEYDKYPLSSYKWKIVLSKVSQFGIKMGHVSCTYNSKLCKERQWTSSSLILALPQFNQASKSVSYLYDEFENTPTVNSVLQWVSRFLASQVKQIKTVQRLQNWLKFSDGHITKVRVMLFTTQQSCPMFFSSLAVKFQDRIPFTIVDVTSYDIKQYLKGSEFPYYLIVTPEDTFIYGSRKSESYNFKSMEIFLNSLHPKISDIWSFLLIFTNTLASFELFLINGEYTFLRQFLIYIVTAIKYNFYLFILMILCTSNFEIMANFRSILHKCLRMISGSYVASLIRSDYKHFYSYPFIIVTFVLYAKIAGLFLHTFKLLHNA